jgi:hypothetical protein
MEICCPKIVRFRLFWGFFVSTYPPQTLTNSQSINSVNSLNRLDYGLGKSTMMVKDTVDVTITVPVKK